MEKLTEVEKKYVRDSLYELPVFPRVFKDKKGKYSAPLKWWFELDASFTEKDFINWYNRMKVVLGDKVKIVFLGSGDNICRVNVFFHE